MRFFCLHAASVSFQMPRASRKDAEAAAKKRKCKNCNTSRILYSRDDDRGGGRDEDGRPRRGAREDGGGGGGGGMRCCSNSSTVTASSSDSGGSSELDHRTRDWASEGDAFASDDREDDDRLGVAVEGRHALGLDSVEPASTLDAGLPPTGHTVLLAQFHFHST